MCGGATDSIHAAMNPVPTLPSDRQLVGAVRGGSDAAWNELMGRHEAPIRSVLKSRRLRRELDSRLVELRDTIEREHDRHEGDPAVRAFRPRALAASTGGDYGPIPYRHDPDDDDLFTPRGTGDDDLLATAFARLPEPWQTVLWHSYVEQLTAAEISPLVGRTAIDVSELVKTAERGLVDAFLIEYISVGSLAEGDDRIVAMLGGYDRGTLAAHDQRKVELHLAAAAPATAPAAPAAPAMAVEPAAAPVAAAPLSLFEPPPDQVAHADPVDRTVRVDRTQRGGRLHDADDSRRLIGVISSLDSVLPAAIAPGITGLTVEAHRRALGTSARSFGAARRPSSRADRSGQLATFGAVAAVVLVLVGAAYLVRQPFDNDGLNITSDNGDTPETTVVDGEIDPNDPNATATTIAEEAPATTLLDLRPPPSGPINEVELVVTEGIRAAGFRQAVSNLEVEVTNPAPIFAGGTGTIDIRVTNSGSGSADATIEIVLPSGVSFDALATGTVSCSDPDDDSPFCSFTVDAGATIEFSLRLRLETSTVGRLVVDGELIPEPLEASIVATRNLVHSSVGRGNVVMLGNSLMTCAGGAAAALGIDCADVRNGVGDVVNRWDVPMEFIGASSDSGIENSSSAVLSLPDSSSIVSAHLYWSGDLDERQQSIPDDGSKERVDLTAPNGIAIEITADEVILGDIDATQYLGEADITDLVIAGGVGSYAVSNVQSVEVQGSYAGWSMVVVYDNAAEPRRHRLVTRPFQWIAPEPRFELAADLPVPVVGDATAHLDVLAFEGERGFTPETLSVAGREPGDNAVFDSTILGDRNPSYDNNLGVDIDAYDLTIDTPAGILPISANSEKDGIRVAVLALTVDLAS